MLTLFSRRCPEGLSRSSSLFGTMKVERSQRCVLRVGHSGEHESPQGNKFGDSTWDLPWSDGFSESDNFQEALAAGKPVVIIEGE